MARGKRTRVFPDAWEGAEREKTRDNKTRSKALRGIVRVTLNIEVTSLALYGLG
jgi:hypothetical protein